MFAISENAVCTVQPRTVPSERGFETERHGPKSLSRETPYGTQFSSEYGRKEVEKATSFKLIFKFSASVSLVVFLNNKKKIYKIKNALEFKRNE